jgi:hypothetical protein
LEARRHPKSKKGTIICQGNLVDARARLRTAGKTIATSQRAVFHFRRLFLSEYFMCCVFFG